MSPSSPCLGQFIPGRGGLVIQGAREGGGGARCGFESRTGVMINDVARTLDCSPPWPSSTSFAKKKLDPALHDQTCGMLGDW